jgi:holin-like protein
MTRHARMGRKILLLCRRGLRRNRPLQIALLLAIWLASEGLVRMTGCPIPAGILGLLIVLALLVSRRISPRSMRRGANWFIADMLLFFIPAVPAILDHHEFFGWLGLKVLAVILLGTTMVMMTTALTVDLCCRWSLRHDMARHPVA